jgi:hypothetical protein
MPDHPFDAEIATLKHVQAKMVSSANKLAWRAAHQGRMRRIATLIRTLPSILTSRSFSRLKEPTGWSVIVTDAAGRGERVLEVVTRTPARTVSQLRERVIVRIFTPDYIVMPRLQELASSGLITIVPAEDAT